MRFIRKRQITTTLCNNDFADNDTIRVILDNIKKDCEYFSIVIRKNFSYDYKDIRYDKSKIFKINEDNSIDIISIQNNCNVKLNNIAFSDIIELESISKTNSISVMKENPSRFDLMEIF